MNGTLSKVIPGRNCNMQTQNSGTGAKTIVKFRPLANISQTKNGWNIDIALPGYSKKDIHIDIVDRNLKISSATSSNNEENNTALKSSVAMFERTFLLPENASEKEIKASLTQGILHLFIPVQEEKITKINIQ